MLARLFCGLLPALALPPRSSLSLSLRLSRALLLSHIIVDGFSGRGVMNISLGNLFTEDLAVDLGTVHTFVYARGRGMVVNEPSLVAIDRVTNQVIAVGTEALEMLGRSPEDVEIAYPMQSGVVADSNLAQDMLKKFVRKARGGRARFSRRIIQSVPSGITSVERFAIHQVIEGIGASRVYLVEEGLAAALGAKLPVAEM